MHQAIIGKHKLVRSPHYNYNFNMETGEFARWGSSLEDDPEWAPKPEILDVEITSKCNGPSGKLCPFCYKSNNPDGHNMSLEEFKKIIDMMPWLTQIALGADAQGSTNPDMIAMMQYARSKNIIPNLTIADVSPRKAKELAEVAGAVAVSAYQHVGFKVAYRSIANLKDAGVKQINIHYMISEETIAGAYDLIEDLKHSNLMEYVNAIVFLSLKQKGKGVDSGYVSQAEYKDLVTYCLDNEVRFGFDSCSAPTFLDSVKDHPMYEKFYEMAEPCESTLFSSYINEKGVFYPCSFTELWAEGGWEEGLDVLASTDFIKDIWNHPKTKQFRKSLIGNKDSNGCRSCPAFAVCGKDMRVYKDDVQLLEVS
jgi:radical SAM protein with 4Fe4S-binding SPASM domain